MIVILTIIAPALVALAVAATVDDYYDSCVKVREAKHEQHNDAA